MTTRRPANQASPRHHVARFKQDPPCQRTPNSLHPPCPLWKRLLALVYDLLIVVAIVMVVGLLCQLAAGGNLITTGPQTVVPPWYQALQAVVVSTYFVSSWRHGGQTVGMRPWRIRVTDAAGNRPSMRQSLIRLLIAGAPLLALTLAPMIGLQATLWTVVALWAGWFALALFDSRRRALHDLVAGTEVSRLV